jgi:signal transduction histidine kinase
MPHFYTSPPTLSTPYVPGSVVVYMLSLYAVAIRGGNRVTLTAAGVTVFGAAALDSPTAAIALPAMIPIVLGHLVRLRRSTRQVLADQEARHEAETAVLEERQRIARELHEVVAHHMSVIAIQAEAAPYKVSDPPPELAESFAEIRASALEGLSELRRVLGVLRTGDEPQTAPQPGLERPRGSARLSAGRRPDHRGVLHRRGVDAAAGRGAVGAPHPAGGAEQRHVTRPARR